ncbi:MAG: hypothetical protein Q4B52_05415 [Tissierellia bacterium]|nr:hypothetical protein [Tissierellia bacterium]
MKDIKQLLELKRTYTTQKVQYEENMKDMLSVVLDDISNKEKYKEAVTLFSTGRNKRYDILLILLSIGLLSEYKKIPVKQNDILKVTNLDYRVTFAKYIEELINAGLIIRKINKYDKVKKILILTDQGKYICSIFQKGKKC